MNNISTSQPLYKQIYDNIKKSLISGEIPSGSRLVVNQLQETFQISRTPIREALRQLENEGLLTQDKMGATVIKLNKEDFIDLYDCRLLLEKEAVGLIIDKITDSELSDIKKLLILIDKSIKEEDYSENLRLNTDFHDLILKSCPNKRLIQMLVEVRSMLLLYRANIVKGLSNNRVIQNEHIEIFISIEKRDLHATLSTVEVHLLNDKERGLKLFENHVETSSNSK